MTEDRDARTPITPRPTHLLATEDSEHRHAMCGAVEGERLDMTIDPADATCPSCHLADLRRRIRIGGRSDGA